MTSGRCPQSVKSEAYPSRGRNAKALDSGAQIAMNCPVLRDSKEKRSMEPRQLRLPGFTRLWGQRLGRLGRPSRRTRYFGVVPKLTMSFSAE